MQHCIIYWQWCGGSCFVWWLNSRNSCFFHPVVPPPPFATGMGSLHSAGGPRTSCGSFVMLNRAATQSFGDTFLSNLPLSHPMHVLSVRSCDGGQRTRLVWHAFEVAMGPVRVPDSCLRTAAWFPLNYDLRWHHFELLVWDSRTGGPFYFLEPKSCDSNISKVLARVIIIGALKIAHKLPKISRMINDK